MIRLKNKYLPPNQQQCLHCCFFGEKFIKQIVKTCDTLAGELEIGTFTPFKE